MFRGVNADATLVRVCVSVLQSWSWQKKKEETVIFHRLSPSSFSFHACFVYCKHSTLAALASCSRIVTSVAFQWGKSQKKCGLTVQTEVALQTIKYVPKSRPPMRMARFWFGKKIDFCLLSGCTFRLLSSPLVLWLLNVYSRQFVCHCTCFSKSCRCFPPNLLKCHPGSEGVSPCHDVFYAFCVWAWPRLDPLRPP